MLPDVETADHNEANSAQYDKSGLDYSVTSQGSHHDQELGENSCLL